MLKKLDTQLLRCLSLTKTEVQRVEMAAAHIHHATDVACAVDVLLQIVFTEQLQFMGVVALLEVFIVVENAL